MKHAAYMVWPVSGQPADPMSVSNRFAVGSKMFYDKTTQRHWYAGDQLTDQETTWETAIDSIRRLNESKSVAYHDWRLPNIRELDSLVDDARHSPALASGAPFNTAPSGYWSSTTSVYEPRYAWVLYTLDGALGVGFKPRADFHVIAVRG